jgi:hypothetical protein
MNPSIDAKLIRTAIDALNAAHATLLNLNADGVLRADILIAEAGLRGALMAALPERLELRDAA